MGSARDIIVLESLFEEENFSQAFGGLNKGRPCFSGGAPASALSLWEHLHPLKELRLSRRALWVHLFMHSFVPHCSSEK